MGGLPSVCAIGREAETVDGALEADSRAADVEAGWVALHGRRCVHALLPALTERVDAAMSHPWHQEGLRVQ